MPSPQTPPSVPSHPSGFTDNQHSPLELENRLTKLETTVSNFRWFLAVGLAVVGLGMPLVIYALESSA